MSNTMLYKVSFIDNDFYTNTYNTAFLTEWNSKSEAEKSRFIELASTRVKSLSSRAFVVLDDLEQEQGEGVQVATSRLIDYWMEYGLDLNRISGSMSLGSYSASQTVPSDPDYIPKHVYDVLQDIGLYSPIGFVTDDIYRYDDDREVTYGVRFKTLERVKEIALDKTDAEDANKGLSIPTTQKVLEDIRDAKLSPFVIIGNLIFADTQTTLPSSALLNALFTSTGLVLEDGTHLVPALTGGQSERVPVKGEAIRVKLKSGIQEISDFDGSLWEIDETKNTQSKSTNDNTLAIEVLNGNTQDRAIKAVEGDSRYIRIDGSNTMQYGYTPTNVQDVMTKGLHDADIKGLQQNVDNNAKGITAIDTTIGDMTNSIVGNTAGITDYVTNKADFLRLEDVSGATEIDFFTPITMIHDGANIVIDLAGASVSIPERETLSKFVTGRLVTIQATPNPGVTYPVEYARDSWNNNMGTANVILGRDVSILTTYNSVAQQILISGLTQNDITSFIRDFKITSLSQLGGSAGAGIDAVARTQATSAQATATQAKVTSDTNTASITTLTTSIANKQNSDIPGSTTTSKTVEGAIRELDARAKNNESDVAELNKGNFDVKGDGTVIQKFFDGNGEISIGLNSDLAQNYGEGAKTDQAYGAHATGIQSYGRQAIGDQAYGYAATGNIQLGSSAHVDGDGKGELIHGSKTATFENVIDLTSGGATSMEIEFDDGTKSNYKVGK